MAHQELTDGEVSSYDLFVDGEFVESTNDSRIDVEYPYDGTVWATVPAGTPEDVDNAVTSARRAYEESGWREMGPSARSELLRDIADVIDDHVDELGRLETLQNGKLYREMRGQMAALGEWYRYYASLCHTMEGRVIPVENKDGQLFNYVRKEPVGVIGAITPWNSPLLLTTWKLAPALAAGNTFVHKPSEHTPVSALRFAELLYEYTDLPEGIYNVVPGAGEIGASLADHDDVDKLAFTGSTEVGREVARTAGNRLVPVTLELGGKSANVVFPDADLDNVSNGVVKGIFAATGQTCLAGSRVIVHESIYDEFVDRFVERASTVSLGDPLESDTQMGPTAFPDQRAKVERYVDLAREEGGTIRFGGEQLDDMPGQCFTEPTIITDLDNEARVAQEEIFGPVATVIPFADEAEALALANDSDYGLAAGIWTADSRRAHRLAGDLEAGTVWVNEYRTVSAYSPFGGYKDSGLGRENGREGLEEYLQTKSIWIDQAGEVDDPFTLG